MNREVSAEAMAAKAEKLDAMARHHKREERRHRNAARSAREQIAELERKCSELGIKFSFQKGAGHFHGPRSNPRSRHAD